MCREHELMQDSFAIAYFASKQLAEDAKLQSVVFHTGQRCLIKSLCS